MEKIFEKHKIDGVIHLAGLKVVSESIEKPLQYYQNNVVGALNLLHVCDKYRVNKFVFSSSAAVYGDKESPFKRRDGIISGKKSVWRNEADLRTNFFRLCKNEW